MIDPGRRIVVATLVGAAVGFASGAAVARAAFSSPATASQSISTRTLVAPASLTATPSGHDVSLSWPAGSNGSGYAVATANNGTSSNCTAVSFSALASTAATTYADTGRYLAQGTYQCYQVATTYGTWSSLSGNPTAAAQLGFVASTIAVTNGGVAGTLDPGDKIVITYNQPVTTASGPVSTNKVCTNAGSSGAIVMIGDAISGCATSTPLTVGSLSGGTASRSSSYSTTWTWSAGNTVLTATIGTRATGTGNPTISGTLAFAPTTTAASMLSATGSFHNCDTNTGGGNCLPTVTGSF
jgi:hypothetical protein